MADLLRAAMVWLGGKVTAFASQTVTYHAVALNLDIPVAAAIGPGQLAMADGTVVLLEYESREFVVFATDLATDPTDPATQIIPQRGDTIAEAAADGKTYIYTVMIPSVPGLNRQQAWTWADLARTRRLIHTKLTDTQT